MHAISIATVATLIGQSERTLRRRIADGTLVRIRDEREHRTMVSFDSVKDQFIIPLEEDDSWLVAQADMGDVKAQTDLAVLFLSHDKIESACYWLELAAKQDDAEAMHWLGRLYLEGRNLQKDEDLGMMWLAKAAAHGHLISQAQMQSIRNRVVASGS